MLVLYVVTALLIKHFSVSQARYLEGNGVQSVYPFNHIHDHDIINV